MYPVVTHMTRNVGEIQRLVILICLISTIGIANEVFEYILRLGWGLTDPQQFAMYYTDTIIDMLINLVGSLAAGIALNILKRY